MTNSESLGCVPGVPHPGESCIDLTVSDPGPEVGARVRLIATSDEHTALEPGAEGYVLNVDDLGTVHVLWDSGQYLGLIPDEDEWEVTS